MPDLDQIQTIGQQLTTMLVNGYGGKTPGANLVFLPAGCAVPDSLIQGGVVNPTAMSTFLSINVDYPFIVTQSDASIIGWDKGHGTASQVYRRALSSAVPLGSPTDDGWKRLDAEIADARQSLGPIDSDNLVCEPDDWPGPSKPYWMIFDSSKTDSTSTTTVTKVPVVNRNFWMLRSMAVPANLPVQAAVNPPLPLNDVVHRSPVAMQPIAATAIHRASLMTLTRPVNSEIGVATEAAAIGPLFRASDSHVTPAAVRPMAFEHVAQYRLAANTGRLPDRLDSSLLLAGTQAVSTVTTAQSTSVTVHLEHQCVTLGRLTAGRPWWDGVFLADPGWYVPGMPRGGFLPAPTAAASDAVYGLPVALIVVQNLRVSANWSKEATDALNAKEATIGPLSLFGAVASSAAGSTTVTYTRDGMQVVGILYSPLPVLPPNDTPAAPPSPPAATPEAALPDAPSPEVAAPSEAGTP